MATLKLTDRAVEAASAKSGSRVELWDTHTSGLCLRVSANKKAWLVRYRVDGTQRRYVFAEYPGKSLLDARIDAATILRDAKKGIADPAGDKGRVKAEARAQPIKTFRHLADAYMAACRAGEWRPKGKPQSPRTMQDASESLSRHILPALGDLKLEEVTRPVVRKFLRGMAARGIGAQTNKALAVIRQIYSFGIVEIEGKLVAINVAIGHPRELETPRSRVMTDAEIKTLWTALSTPGGLRLVVEDDDAKSKTITLSRRMAICLQLSMLLLQRRAEIVGMMASELNLDEAVWLIPGPRMKARRPHLVPLPPLAVTLIREAMSLANTLLGNGGRPNDYPIFPSPRDPARPIAPTSVTHALSPVVKALGIDGVSPHDLRRTGATVLTSERLGVTPFIRSLVIAHSDTGGGAVVSSRHYDANLYVAEKRRALTAWADLVERIASEGAA